MAKTSESVSVLIRAALWECATLALLPFLMIFEVIRWAYGYIAKQFRD